MEEKDEDIENADIQRMTTMEQAGERAPIVFFFAIVHVVAAT